MTEDQSSRRQDFERRLEEWINAARGGIERQAPDVLDKLAATARDLARRLDDLASDARQKRAEKDAAPEAGTASKPEAQTAEAAGGTSTPSTESPGPSEESEKASA